MTREDILAIAESIDLLCGTGECAIEDGVDIRPAILEFANIIASSEREACAKICDGYNTDDNRGSNWAAECADDIRARSNP